MHADRDRSDSPWWPPSATREPTIADEPIGPAGGAPAGNPLHGIAHDRDADRTIPTDDERLTRYAEAANAATDLHEFFASHGPGQRSHYGCTGCDLRFADRRGHPLHVAYERTHAVMAVADAEQAELRAEVERLNAYNTALVKECDTLRNSAPKFSGYCSPETGPVEDCPLHGRSIKEVWELVSGASEYGAMQWRRAEAAKAKVARVEALTPEVLTERVSASLRANQDQQVEAVVLDVIRAAMAEPETTDATVYASVPHDREIHTPDALEWPGKEDA